MNTIYRELKDIASQLYRLERGWRTFPNILKQLASYIRNRA